MSRHEKRQELAREFGATDVVVERCEEGVARIQELTNRRRGRRWSPATSRVCAHGSIVTSVQVETASER
jgi:hypothetical protein